MIDIYWWSRAKDYNEKLENFGDILVPYLLDRTTPEKYNWIVPNTNRTLRVFRKKWHYLIIGSILRKATEHSIIWGAGIMFTNSVVRKAKFLLVRGPITRKRLLELGCNVPERYGDPALLISLFNKPVTEKKYKIGIVPHFLDFEEVYSRFGENQDIRVINILTTNPQEVIDEINGCEKILSSSLHGIIVSHALKIPALWLKVSDKLKDDIKFYDYYSSLNINISSMIYFNFNSSSEIETIFQNNLDIALPEKKNIDKLIKDLVETFPFKKSTGFKDAIEDYFS